jgi:hypothetical protein
MENKLQCSIIKQHNHKNIHTSTTQRFFDEVKNSLKSKEKTSMGSQTKKITNKEDSNYKHNEYLPPFLNPRL